MLTNGMTEKTRPFERALAFHCAPSMAGIKAADLFSWPGAPEDTLELLELFGQQLGRSGICLRRLCFCRGRSLILVYRPALLRKQLQREDVRRLLGRDGYPVEGEVEQMLDRLGARILATPNDFPHEVGLFLGYPTADVEGYRKHNGRDFKFCGLWKVYSDVERAQTCFQRYKCCRAALCRRVEGGCPLHKVFRAA